MKTTKKYAVMEELRETKRSAPILRCRGVYAHAELAAVIMQHIIQAEHSRGRFYQRAAWVCPLPSPWRRL